MTQFMIIGTGTKTAFALVFSLLMVACSELGSGVEINSGADTSSGTDTDTDTGTDTDTDTDTDTGSGSDPEAAFVIDESSGNWVINDNNERSQNIFEEDTNTGVLVNVESVSIETVGGVSYIRVESSGVPNYTVTVDQELLDTLAARPNALDDFRGGSANIDVGDVVQFGQDIGYKSSSNNCNTTGGFGYWTPGPPCPQDVDVSALFTTAPTYTTRRCETGLGTIGLFSNGTAIYDWNDGQSYQSAGVWQHTAAKAEVHDLDICSGHAASEYHHHNYSTCLANELEDTGDAHSPVYGVAADGYPVHGPWQANDILAVSSWLARDYNDANSASGCGVSGERSCLLVNEYDITQGTTPASSNGPLTSVSITSGSGNTISAEPGLYFQDYYNDSALVALGGAYLDRHNGHEHNNLGYHYHLTITQNTNGGYTPSFPFTFGPTFKGVLDDNALRSCGTSIARDAG